MGEAIPVREFIRPKALGGKVLPAKELRDKLKVGHDVLFDDGVLHLSANEIVFNRYIWEIFVVCDKIPIKKKHSVSEYYSEGFYTSDSLSSVVSAIFEDVCDVYVRPNEDRTILNDYLYEAFGDIYNNIYNELVCHNKQYATSIDIEDFLEIQVKDNILKSILDVKKEKSEESIARCHGVVRETLKHDPSVVHNTVRKGYVSGTFNNNQTHSIIGSVGYVSDINNNIFRVPISNSYTLGLQQDYEMAIATRLAASSIFKSTTNIKNSEYTARIIQFVTMRVEHLVDGDCGSKEYIELTIENENDFKAFLGKRYVSEDGSLKSIKSTDKHLIGQTLKLRSPLKCAHKRTNSVCTVCMGDTAYSIPWKSNLGHTCSSNVSEVLSQLTLSDRHHQNSATGIDYQLDPSIRHFVKNKHALMFNTSTFKTKTCRYQMLVTHEAMKGMVGLTPGMDLSNINNKNCSRIEEVVIIFTNKKSNAQSTEHCYIAFSKKGSNSKKEVSKKSIKSKINGFFSHKFLEYMLEKEGRYVLTDTGTSDSNRYYCIELDDWINDPKRRNEPVIEYPVLQFNLANILSDLKSEVNDSAKKQTPEDFLLTLHSIINSKITINISLIEVIALAFSVNPNSNDVHVYRGKDAAVANIKTILQNGSLSGFYGYENHKTMMLNPVSFNGLNNVDHPLDGLLCPEEVMQEVKEGKRR